MASPKTTLLPGFWHDRQTVNAEKAIFHQWEELEASGCIENFRLVAGEKDGFREGWFFADSDAYKWLDAAARIARSTADTRLASLMDAFIALLGRAQSPDGYLFTYNQLHFPGVRWVNLQIEHELYCHGHLIEAGVSHYAATGRTDMLAIARRAADRIVADFTGKGPSFTPGHEEIEIALLRLYQATGHTPYLEMARQFIERRGRTQFFPLSLLRQNSSVRARSKFAGEKKRDYQDAHPEFEPFQLPPGNAARKPRNANLRRMLSGLSGKYFQQHAPVRRQTIPVGHSVRFGYLETAIAMLVRLDGDATFIPALERVWEHMVTRRMYLTGGIGSLPELEGFGNDYELDPEYAYAETCAGIACLFWNWEMVQLTGAAKYSDLFEWQLYNAVAVGMGMDGTTYLYNNPLTCRGGITRKPWYAVPCCPSNITRTWADLGKYIVSSGVQKLQRLDEQKDQSRALPGCLAKTWDSESKNQLWIHQYISSEFETYFAKLELHSDFPWNGNVQIKIESSAELTLHIRLPSWSQNPEIKINQNNLAQNATLRNNGGMEYNFSPQRSTFLSIIRTWSPTDLLELNFDMHINLRRAHPKVKGHSGKVAITRGPLVYCLESVDNPNIDIFNSIVDPASLHSTFDASILGGIMKIEAKTTSGESLTFIPYTLWGNRGGSVMTVWVNE